MVARVNSVTPGIPFTPSEVAMTLPAPPRRPGARAALAALLCLKLVLAGALALPLAPAAAQGSLPPGQQAVLDEVRRIVGDPGSITVQQRPDGSYFADAHGRLQAVLLAATGADGQVLTRCVETLEEAAAFLAEAPALTAAAPVEPAADAVAGAPDSLALAGTRFEIVVADGPGEGFNDPTPAEPVGGNPGTTVGEQRLKAFEYAAAIWASHLQSTVPIQIRASFNPLACTASGAVLGSAGPATLLSDFPGDGYFPGAAEPDTWYVSALANQRAGADLSPGTPDLVAQFNSNLGRSNCLAGSGWYYGFDGKEEQSGTIDLVVVLLHEFSHGLGFLSTVNLADGATFESRDDIWNYYLTGAPSAGPASMLWKDLNPAQRAASAVSDNLVWGGAGVNAAAARLYGAAAPRIAVTGGSPAGPFDGRAAPFGPPFGDTPIGAALVAAVDQDEDGEAPAYSADDACTPLANAAAVGGKVALVSRGPCAPSAQARHLQAAGAVAAVIADSVAVDTPPDLMGGDAGVTIPTMSVTKAAGDSLRARLEQGPAVVALSLARTPRPGIDSLGRVKMYAPGNLQPGSSVSHFDTAPLGPDLLMEPRITMNLGQGLDLTDELLRDIGWLPDLNFNGLDDRKELDLGVSQVAPSTLVRAGGPFTLTITVRNRGYTTAGVNLAGSFPGGAMGFQRVSWTAEYSGGAAGPVAGAGNIAAAITLPPGSSAVFAVSATSPLASGPVGASKATIALAGGDGLVDVSGAADDGASLSLRATTGEIRQVLLPVVRR
jgi:hypothetical protein